MKIAKIKMLMTTTILSTSLVSLTNCSNTELSKQLLDQAVEEFVALAKTPRPSGYHDKIVEYLTNRIESLGYKPYKDDAHNIWFDVPASKGYENHKKLILQAHSDMVIDGLTHEQSLVMPIQVQYHSNTNTLTSKDYKTSLGADNGIGIGTIFSLLKNNRVKHGPIRVIFTSDEEIGMIGANKLDKDVIDSDYLISLDGELPNEGYYRSCQGTIQYDYSKQFNTEDKTSIIKSLNVKGFTGGHSGNDINKGLANAIVFLFDVLNDLNDESLQIVDFKHINDNGQIVNPAANAIATYGTIRFITTKSDDDLINSINNVINKYKDNYKGENWDNVKYVLSEIQEKSKPLSVDDSSKLISILTNKDNKGIKYGVQEVDKQTNRPLKSANISPMSIDNGVLNFKCQSRAVTIEYLSQLRNQNKKAWVDCFGIEGVTTASDYNPWEANVDDKIIKSVIDGYKSIGIEPASRDTNGGVEPTVFKQKRKTINITCLGTKFESTHSVKETCYLSPLQNTIKVILYVFENMNKI